LVATDELLCLKNVDGQISMFFYFKLIIGTHGIMEKFKILGSIFHLPAKQHCHSGNPASLPRKWAKWAELAVLFS
jgi:hypothetical protein